MLESDLETLIILDFININDLRSVQKLLSNITKPRAGYRLSYGQEILDTQYRDMQHCIAVTFCILRFYAASTIKTTQPLTHKLNSDCEIIEYENIR